MRRASLFDHFRCRYGANPLHLAAHLVVFAIAAFAIVRIASGAGLVKLIGLYVGFVIAHDLVFMPVYSGLDRAVRAMLARVSVRSSARVPAINHIRAPAVISGVLLIIYAPLISGKADAGYFQASGHHLEGYLRNWLLISVILFVGSGLIYALRLRRALVKARRDCGLADLI